MEVIKFNQEYYLCYYFSRLTMEVQKDSPKQEGEIKKPWHEIVPSFSGTSVGVYEALGNFQAEYGFKHGYQSDTDSFKIETESTITQFELLHEDDMEDMGSMQPSDFESLKDKGTLRWRCVLSSI